MVQRIDDRTLKELWKDPPERQPDLSDKTIVYLDQKEWGHLLDGHTSESSPYRAAYEFVRKSTEEMNVVYPFSIENMIETGRSGSRSFRKELFEVIFKVSRNYSIGNYFHALNYEAQAYLHKNDPDLDDINPKEKLFGKGLIFPHGDFAVESGDWLSEEQVETLKKVISSDTANEFLFRSEDLIDFRTNEDIDEIDEYLESIEKSRKSAAVDGLSPESQRHREDYVISAFREMMLPRLYHFADGLNLDVAVIIQIDGFAADFGAYFSQFPAFYTYANLAFARDSHLDRDVELNDLWDIFSLATATPYSDIVITEQFFGGMLHKYEITDVFDTTVLFNVNELEQELF